MAIRNPAKLLGITPRNDTIIAHTELRGVAQDVPPSS